MIFFWGKKKKKDAADAPPADAASQDAPSEAPTEASEGVEAPVAAQAEAPRELEPERAPPLAPVPAPEPKPEPLAEPEPEAARPAGFFSRLAEGLRRSSSRLSENVSNLFTKRRLDAEALEELEELLIAADLGARPAGRVVAALAKDKFDKEISDADVRAALAGVVAETLRPHAQPLDLSGAPPQVVLFVGVNGSGKTTTLGKIAAMVTGQGRAVVLAAGDTFRAAAIEQIKVWGERAGADVIARQTGADAAGLVYDAYEQARASGADLLLIDTAGRLQNKRELMEELSKIVRVLRKQDPSAPHHVLLVLDATVGQNALSQVDAFRDVADVSGLIMTKLDGTAKGGVLVAIADRHPDLPIYFTGVGEAVDDLAPFDPDAFARALAGL